MLFWGTGRSRGGHFDICGWGLGGGLKMEEVMLGSGVKMAPGLDRWMFMSSHFVLDSYLQHD